MSSRDNIATYETIKGCHDIAANKTRDNKMRRRGLYTSNHTGIPAYLMDFGFGGFLGYGRRASCCVGEEELKMYEGYQVCDLLLTVSIHHYAYDICARSLARCKRSYSQ